MIQYALKCHQDHRFDSWFQSAAAFDKLADAGMVTCAVCGSERVEKALMAPRVSANRREAAAETPRPAKAPSQGTAPKAAPAAPLSAPASAVEEALGKLRRHIEANSTYVGKNFVREARAIHAGEAPERSIYGEAKIEDARALAEEGVPVAPLPFLPKAKAN